MQPIEKKFAQLLGEIIGKRWIAQNAEKSLHSANSHSRRLCSDVVDDDGMQNDVYSKPPRKQSAPRRGRSK